MEQFIEFKEMPQGIFRCEYQGIEIYVFRPFDSDSYKRRKKKIALSARWGKINVWRYNLRDIATGYYLGFGYKSTADRACESAVRSVEKIISLRSAIKEMTIAILDKK